LLEAVKFFKIVRLRTQQQERIEIFDRGVDIDSGEQQPMSTFFRGSAMQRARCHSPGCDFCKQRNFCQSNKVVPAHGRSNTVLLVNAFGNL
jgi:hypothetical protein